MKYANKSEQKEGIKLIEIIWIKLQEANCNKTCSNHT